MRVYKGVRSTEGCVVTVNSQPLPPRLRPDSTGGFNWGDIDEAAGELAYSLLADVVGINEARSFAQHYKQTVVSSLPHERWRLTAEEIRLHVAALKMLQVDPAAADRDSTLGAN